MPNRAPIYDKEDKRFRVISLPNGRWQAQRLDEGAKRSNTADPWRALGRPGSQEEALACMKRAAA